VTETVAPRASAAASTPRRGWPLKPRVLTVALLVALAVAGGLAWWLTHRPRPASELVLYGNVDLRQVDLAFNGAERVEAVLVSEGDRVHRGQLLARLDTGRLTPKVAQAAGEADAQAQVAEKLRNGNRPEDIAEARDNVAVALAEAVATHERFAKVQALAASSAGRALSRQEVDDAKGAADAAAARLAASQQAFRVERIGPRKEDVAQAQAQLQARRGGLALLRRELSDANLVAPTDAIVRSRLIEAGDMASPARPAFSLAITDPKWVRAYVTVTDLGQVRPGNRATISTDAFPKRRFAGWVGFISPVAEFTPKTVQTPELRTSLVYEIRVFVKDPGDELRPGMPATVHLPVMGSVARRGG
jgi:HlyD family secretion protein